jgi:rieske iron-sulfur protein
LVRLPVDKMDATTKDRSADGVVAYSAVCTHQGCDVSEWQKEDNTLLCFCHFSKYNPYSDADVMAGPAPRNLPSLALKKENGVLVVAGKFSSAPGARNS